jgi:hypothetical protein
MPPKPGSGLPAVPCLPPLENLLTLKGTSIVSVPAVHDLLYSVQLVYINQTYQVIPPAAEGATGRTPPFPTFPIELLGKY